MAPKVSVLIPNYNFARYLPEAIESVLAQDFQDFELIIVDNCSADDSAAVIRRYAARDQRIEAHINPVNLGMVGNLNKCLSLARGEYIKFVFADDLLASPQALGRLVQMLDRSKSIVLAASARNIIDEDSRFICVRNDLGGSGIYRGVETLLRCLEKNSNLVGEPSAALFRKSASRRGFNHIYNQLTDLEMWIYLLEQGDVAYTSDALCSFRRHPSQQTELNQADIRTGREQLALAADVCQKPWFKSEHSRKAVFTQLYFLQKRRRHELYRPEVELELKNTLRPGDYARLYMLNRSSKSLFNMKRFFRKHILRRQFL